MAVKESNVKLVTGLLNVDLQKNYENILCRAHISNTEILKRIRVVSKSCCMLLKKIIKKKRNA